MPDCFSNPVELYESVSRIDVGQDSVSRRQAPSKVVFGDGRKQGQEGLGALQGRRGVVQAKADVRPVKQNTL